MKIPFFSFFLLVSFSCAAPTIKEDNGIPYLSPDLLSSIGSTLSAQDIAKLATVSSQFSALTKDPSILSRTILPKLIGIEFGGYVHQAMNYYAWKCDTEFIANASKIYVASKDYSRTTMLLRAVVGGCDDIVKDLISQDTQRTKLYAGKNLAFVALAFEHFNLASFLVEKLKEKGIDTSNEEDNLELFQDSRDLLNFKDFRRSLLDSRRPDLFLYAAVAMKNKNEKYFKSQTLSAIRNDNFEVLHFYSSYLGQDFILSSFNNETTKISKKMAIYLETLKE